MIEINKCKLVPGITSNWGDILGDITKQQDLVDYVASHGGGVAEWGSITGDISDQEDLMTLLDEYAKKDWVESQGYLVQDDLSQYATRQWVTGRGYATEDWVSNDYTNTVVTGAQKKAEENVKDWVVEEGYINQIKTVNNQSLVGTGNIEISGLTPEQEEAVEPLMNPEGGMLYTFDLERYRGTGISNGSGVFNDGAWKGRIYNIDGDVYIHMWEDLYKWNPDIFNFEYYKHFNNFNWNYPLWKDNSGRFYVGPEFELDFEQGECVSIALGCNSYTYIGNRQTIWKGQYGIYNLTSGQKFDESTQQFISWTFNVEQGYDIYSVGETLATRGVEYDGHYVAYNDSNQMFELIEYQDRIEYVSVNDPYFPNTALDMHGNQVELQSGFYYNISGELYYLHSSNSFRFEDGEWVQFVCSWIRGGWSFQYNIGHGVVCGDLLIGSLTENFDGFIDIISVSTSIKKTYWASVSSYTLDLMSDQYVKGTKRFDELRSGSISDVRTISTGLVSHFYLQKNTTTAFNIDLTVSGSFKLNGNPIATAADCILNKETIGYGDNVVDVCNTPNGPYRTDYWTTNTGRLFHNTDYEFNGTAWVQVTPVLDSVIYAPNVVQAGTETFYVNGATWKWDDANSQFVQLTTDAPYTGWYVWPCGDGELRASGEYKLVNNGGTWSWVSDTVQDYKYGMTYYIDGHVYVLSLNDDCVYEYDESTKTYTQLGRYNNWSEFSFTACGKIFYPYNAENIHMIDFSLVDPNDPDKYIDVLSQVYYSSYDFFYGEFNGYLYFFRNSNTLSYCYSVQYDKPEVPSTDGTYVLKATVLNGQVTYSWVPENAN